MKVISFNINSVRARLHQVKCIINEHKPDVIGLQETKVQDEAYPFEDIEKMGYKSHVHGQKGHYGVALLFKDKPLSLGKGFKTDDSIVKKDFCGLSIKLKIKLFSY